MRPVEKLIPGSIVTLSDGAQQTILSDYNPHGLAKTALVANLGMACSYCEDSSHVERNLDVEHIQPKGLPQYAALRTKWSNFLLSCHTCNGSDNKDTHDVILGEVHLPHLNNTFLSLQYDAGGVVRVNPALTGLSYQHAEALFNLLGLGKNSISSCPGDKRWKKRSDDWDLANKYLLKYNAGTVEIDTIIDLVKARGGWSIWFTVFRGKDDVLEKLIDCFEGTAARCFDAANHYEPIERNPGQPDPV